ncbi:MAG: hypothetical protein WCK65_15015, partial [Rhodospirillaceae bacterium]
PAVVRPATAKRRPVAHPKFRLRVRLLPILIFIMVLMLGLRIGDFWRVITRNGGFPELYSLQAETAPPAAGKDAAKKEPAKAAGKEPAKDPAKGESNPRAADDGLSGRPKPETIDVELVKQLSERRMELERRSKMIDQREALMVATEKRLEQKLAELEGLRVKITELLKQVDDKQKAQLESLVRIYENMKPKEAARIFEQLEPEVLIRVVERMKDTKTAAVLAAMDPIKARDVTTRLAEQRRLPNVP